VAAEQAEELAAVLVVDEDAVAGMDSVEDVWPERPAAN
jgi:hypothetical protein